MRASPQLIATSGPNNAGYFRDIATGIQNFARQRPDWVLIEERSMAPGQTPCGRIVFRTHYAQLQAMADSGIPTVNTSNFNRQCPVPRAVSGDYAAGALAAKHLLACGYKSFGFVAPQESFTFRQRFEGFEETLATHGQRTVPFWCRCDPQNHYFAPEELAGDTLAEWLRDRPRPAGIYVVDDHAARFLVQCLVEAGRKVPEEYGLVGTNNLPQACLFTQPQLTSVALDGLGLGTAAAGMLDLLLQGERPPEVVAIPPRMIVMRESTALVRTGETSVREAFASLHAGEVPPLSVEELAARTQRAPVDLARDYAAICGADLHDHLTAARLRYATDLLARTDWPVHEVAAASGYASIGAFQEAFTHGHQIEPSSWRHRRKQSPLEGLAGASGPVR